jgi:hypothetical protein
MFSYLALLYQCIAEAYKSLQDEALLASWKHQLDRDSETLKMKGNLNHLRTVSIFPYLHFRALSIIVAFNTKFKIT